MAIWQKELSVNGRIRAGFCKRIVTSSGNPLYTLVMREQNENEGPSVKRMTCHIQTTGRNPNTSQLTAGASDQTVSDSSPRGQWTDVTTRRGLSLTLNNHAGLKEDTQRQQGDGGRRPGPQ